MIPVKISAETCVNDSVSLFLKIMAIYGYKLETTGIATLLVPFLKVLNIYFLHKYRLEYNSVESL